MTNLPPEETKLVEKLFNTWTHMPRDNYPTWLELSIYMFKAGREHEKETITNASNEL